jgi:aryl sulfotransferase
MRIVRNHTIDSTRWNDFVYREGDIVTVTWAKTGTTWLQQIVAQLIFGGAEGIPVAQLGPWLELRGQPIRHVLGALEAQAHRRFIKTHLAADAIPLSPHARYLYVGRDGRDALWSWYNHHRRISPLVLGFLNGAPDRAGPPLEPASTDVRQYFHDWLERDGHPLWPFWSHVQSWWDLRHRPNVRLIHFNRLKADLPGQIREIARFLEIDVPEGLWPTILEHCSFDYMKSHAATLAPMFETSLEGGAQAFIYKGTNGRWRDVLTAEDIARYEEHALRHLSADCAHWLASGEADQARPSLLAPAMANAASCTSVC